MCGRPGRASRTSRADAGQVGLPEPSVSNTALITGASSGIGAAMATELASRGYSLVLVARREERLRSLAAELSSTNGIEADVVAADLAEEGERDRLADELGSGGRAVELLVNNAGFGQQADFATSPRERMVEMVRACPETSFVLDHIGKPDIRGHRMEPWRTHMSALAALPNVVCKISGVATEADHANWTTDDVRPYVAHALAEFGEDRVLFGGDWPVVRLASSYRR